MKTKFLFPNYFRIIGWILLFPSFLLSIIFYNYELPFLKCKVFALISEDIFEPSKYFSVIETNVTNELFGILLIVAAVFVAFSREKNEDEYISKIRMESLIWAVYVNYGLLILCFILFYGFSFLNIMLYNLYTILIFFIIRFYFMKYKLRKQAKDEE